MTILNKLHEIKSNVSIALGKSLQAYLHVLEEVKGFTRALSKIYPNTSEEATGFNPSNKNFVQRGDVAYALSYKDNGDGTSEVQLIGSPSQSDELTTYNTGKSISNGLKDQVSITLMKNSNETDEIGIVVPTDKGLSLIVCEAKYSVNTSSFKCTGSVRLQANIKVDVSSIGSYSNVQATTLDNGDKFVIARKGKDLVSWYLGLGEEGELEVLAGKNGITERNLLKLGNSDSQFALNGNTLLYSQESTKIEGNQEEKVTDIFSLDITNAAGKARKGEGIEEYLLGNRKGQIDETPFFSSENEINFLQLVERVEEGDVIALLEENKSSNKQRLHLLGLSNGELLSDFPIDELKGPIEQLYVKDNNQDGFTITAISEENITTFNRNSFGESPPVTEIPMSDIQSPSDFMRIIMGGFTPIASSTVDPNTTDQEETSPITDEPTTQGIESTSASASTSNRVSTESAATDSIAASSTTAEKSTVKSTTVKPTETTETDEGYSSSTKSTSPSPITEKASTARTTTVEPTTAAKITTVTSQAPERSTVSTNVPTTSGGPTQTVFTRGVFTGSPTAFTFNTPFLPETSSPEPNQFSLSGPGGSNHAEIAVAVLFVVGIMTFAVVKACKFVVENYRRRNAEPEYGYYKSSAPNRISLENLVRNASGNQPNDIEGASNSSGSNQSNDQSIFAPRDNDDNVLVNPPASSSSPGGTTEINRSPSLSPHSSDSSSNAVNNDKPQSWLQRIISCCGIGNRPYEEITLSDVLASGSKSPGSRRSSSTSRS